MQCNNIIRHCMLIQNDKWYRKCFLQNPYLLFSSSFCLLPLTFAYENIFVKVLESSMFSTYKNLFEPSTLNPVSIDGDHPVDSGGVMHSEPQQKYLKHQK